MSSAYVCPCCFLNRISILRNTPEVSKELVGHDCRSYEVKARRSKRSENLFLDSSSSAVKINNSEDFMYPERLLDDARRSESSHSDHSFFNNQQARSLLFKKETERLAQQIDTILDEQKEFLKELNLTVCDEDGFRVEENQISDVHFGNYGDTVNFNFENNKNTYLSKKDTFYSKTARDKPIVVSKPVFFASGDRKNLSKVENDSSGILRKSANNITRTIKPRVIFTDEPVKLSKAAYEASSSDILRNDSINDREDAKRISVKMLFFPASELTGSNSSLGSDEEARPVQATSSVYMTASNSSEDVRPQNSEKVVSSTSDSSCSLCVKASTSDSRDRLDSEKE